MKKERLQREFRKTNMVTNRSVGINKTDEDE